MFKLFLVLSLTFIFCLASGTSVLASPGSFSIFKTKNLTFSTRNNFKIKYSSFKSNNIPVSTSNKNPKTTFKAPVLGTNTDPVSSKPESKPPKNGLLFSIPKIGLNDLELSLASAADTTDLDPKMLYNPILDTLTSQPCLENSSTYIMGHSEPVNKATSNKPAVRVFQNLDKLSPGDLIEMQNQAGISCQYQVIESEIVVTSVNGDVSQETFNNLYFPQTQGSSILKIQTCVKGSATRRLVLTAIKIK